MSTTSVVLQEQLLKKRAFLYLGLLFGLLFIGWIIVLIKPDLYGILSLFSFLPFFASVVTRIVTRDQASWMLKPKFKKNWKTYLFASYIPNVSIFLGAVAYFLFFPKHLDLSATKLIQTYGQFGVPANLPQTVNSLLRIGIGGLLIAPFVLPIAH